MTDDNAPTGERQALTREDRLAQRLRENLRRRKAQARALGGTPDTAEPPPQS